MIKAAIDRILDLGKNESFNLNGTEYTSRKFHPINNPHPAPLQFSTLNALVDFILYSKDAKVHQFDIIDIVSPVRVKLRSSIQSDMERITYAEASPVIPSFDFDRYISSEDFNISLQAMFRDDSKKHRALLLEAAGNIVENTEIKTQDDGIAQGVTMKKGARVENVIIPNPVALMPIRTFLEVDQPESLFVFRLRDGQNMGIFEADGGAWRHEAIQNIAAYLSEALEETDINILA